MPAPTEFKIVGHSVPAVGVPASASYHSRPGEVITDENGLTWRCVESGTGPSSRWERVPALPEAITSAVDGVLPAVSDGDAGKVLTVNDAEDGYELADAAGGGASVTIREVGPFPFAFNTANILTGAVLCAVSAGDTILDGRIMVDTAFNGTTPCLTLGASDLGGDLLVYGWDLTKHTAVNGSLRAQNAPDISGLVAGASVTTLALWAALTGNSYYIPAEVIINDHIVAVLDDGAGGASGATAGAGRIYLTISTPVAP